MEVKAIQSLSLTNQQTGGLKKSGNNSSKMNYAQMDAPMSTSAAEAIKNNSMISFGEKKKKNHLKNAALATAMTTMMAPGITGCDPIKVETSSWSDSDANATAWAWSISDCPCNNKPDTVKTVIHDSIPVIVHDTVPQIVHDTVPEIVHKVDTIYQDKVDTVYVPKVDTVYVPKVDTVYQDKVDTVYVPKVDTVYQDRVDTVYIPKVDTIYQDRVDTVYVPKVDTVYQDRVDTVYVDRVDTVYQTKVDSLHFKEYPFHIADSLIAHGLNNGFKLNGPKPKENGNNVVFLASVCYNRYDHALYQTYAVDDEQANTGKMATLITRVTQYYDNFDPTVTKDNPKISFIKQVVTDVPGQGIQFENSKFFASRSEASNKDYIPDPFDPRFMQSGKEIHTNLRNGTNRVTIINPVRDKYGNVTGYEKVWRGDFKKGQLDQSFFFNTFARDENGDVYIDENTNQPEQINYDFTDGEMVSRAVEWQEYTPGYFKPNLHQ
ncbi:hypothetical protein J6P92_08295 [bacterium]|nr:hypothetical protein [bacterium]